MTDTLTSKVNGVGLSAPVRNRYFYGKLLDVHHLEMEQAYFLDASRLINRLTLGSGVLCGLRVQALEDNRVAVSPGVAMDGHGREIVVTERVIIDLASLEWAPPRSGSADDPEREGTVLCLAYHECDVEPAPVLVADCDLREDCVPGAVRERFKFELMDAAFAPFPEDPCSILGGLEPGNPDYASHGTAVLEHRLKDSLSRLEAEPGGPVRPRGGEGLRERLCAVFHPPCGPGPACVPVALLTEGDGDEVEVAECPPRRTIYSNAVLLDLILCLAEQMQRCCERRVTVDAPKVVATWPAPGESVKLSDFATQLDLPIGGVAVSFDRPMNEDRLAAPDEWLRLMIVPELTQTGVIPFALKLDRVEAQTLAGEEGQTAYYVSVGTAQASVIPAVADAGLTAPVSIAELLNALGADSARALLMMRSDDVTQIAAKDDAELLDADFHGTALTTEECDLLWTLGGVAPAFAGLVVRALSTPPTTMPTLPASGNGIEGGVFHSSFRITG